MRLLGLTLTAALLSGCSYMGGGFGAGSGGAADSYGPRYGGQGQAGAQHAGAQYGDPCQIAHAQAAVPQGCHPSQVSIGTGGNPYGGGFSQTPQFGGQYADAGYGSHAGGNVHTQGLHGSRGQKVRKPRFRGALDLGVEKSVGGELINYSRSGVNNPVETYNPYLFQQGRAEGVRVSGTLTETRFSADNGAINDRRRNGAGNEFMIDDPANPGNLIVDPSVPTFAEVAPYDVASIPSVSFDDAWSTPASIGLSGEYIVSNRATVFGRVGYTAAEGTSGDAASVSGTVYRDVDVTTFDENGDPVGGTVSNRTFIPEQTLSTFAYDFSDLRRLDLEAGGRFYFDPISGRASGRTVTPFVGASAGASRCNDVSYSVSQRHLSYSSVFDGGEAEYYSVTGNPAAPSPTTQVQLYDSQWVPTGRLAVGAEWQVTPKTALAFETGVKVDGKLDYANGIQGQSNVSVPVTLRGSFNF